MGQRLNIEITYKGKVFANAYYHWSAYSSSAANLVEAALDEYMENGYIWDLNTKNKTQNERNMYSLAIRMLEETGAGANNTERDLILKSKKFKDYVVKPSEDRNTGLLSITPEGIAETERYEESRVTIDIGFETVSFGVFWCQSKAEFIEDLVANYEISREDAEEQYENIPELRFGFGLNEIPFNEFWKLPSDIEENEMYVDDDGYVYSWIE